MTALRWFRAAGEGHVFSPHATHFAACGAEVERGEALVSEEGEIDFDRLPTCCPGCEAVMLAEETTEHVNENRHP